MEQIRPWLLFDGIERPIDDILPEEIESIEVFKKMPQPKSCMEQLPQTEWSWYVLKEEKLINELFVSG